MRIADYCRVAFGNIARAKLRTSLTIFAVVIGATSVTIMLALVTGAKSFVQDQFQASGALQQVIVSQQTDLDYDHAKHGGGGNQGSGGTVLTDAVVNKVKAVPHVVAVTPIADVHILDAISYNGKKLTAERGTAYEANGVVKHSVMAGRDFVPGDGDNTIVITNDYAKKFGFANNLNGIVGQQVDLITQNFYTGPGATVTPPAPPQPGQPSNQPQQQAPTTLHATVVGVVNGDDDGATIYFPMTWAKKLLVQQHYEVMQADQQAANTQMNASMKNLRPGQQPPAPFKAKQTLVSQSDIAMSGYSTILAKADSTKSVDGVASQIRTFGVGAATAGSYVKQQLQIFNIVGLVLGGIGGIALLVSAIGVVNTMVMAILERTREIGVMRAVGATRAHIRRLFTFEAALLGFAGGAFGIGIGYGLTKIANSQLNGQFASSGFKDSNIITLPVWLIVAVLGTTTAIGFLAGLLPAGRAARLNPVEALRYE